MSFDSWLIHTCTIEPAVSGVKNAYNNEAAAYGIPVTGVRCRLIEARERVWSDERQENVIVSVYKLLLGFDAVISEKSIIPLVTLEDGTVVRDRFTVTELFVRRGRNSRHQLAMLERVS
jgi:hypothetical protein